MDPAPTLERVTWSDDPSDAPEPETGPCRVSQDEWAVATERVLASHSNAVFTLCRVALLTESGERWKPSVPELDELCRRIADVHAVEAGVTVTAEGDLLVLLPVEAPWNMLVATIESVRGARSSMESPVARIGLTELTVDTPSLDLAIEFTARALWRADEDGTEAAEWSAEDEAHRSREQTIVAELVESLVRGSGFRLVFQPKIDTTTRAVVGAEGLLRHAGGELGPIGPAEFLPIAERAGILGQLERWVMDEGIAAISMWGEEHALDFPVSLNVRGDEVVRPGFAADLGRMLDTAGVRPELLRLEISESDVLRLQGAIVPVMSDLRDLGVTIALDDFGRAGSSFADLRDLPIDVLKVDRSLVTEMTNDPGAAVLVEGVMSLAAALGIETVAAGVERRDQLERLEALGCRAVQGFLLAEPMEFGEFDEWLIERSRAA